MADLSYANSVLKAAAEHGAGKGFANGNTSQQVVNNALSFLARYAPWEWRTVIASLTTVDTVATVSLPADFGELITVAGQTAPFLTKRFRRVSPQGIVRARQQATAVTADPEAKTTLFYALTGKAQASVTAMRLYQLQLFPTPTTAGGTAVVNAFSLVYRANPPVLSADTDVADIPTDFQAILMDLVRGYARNSEQPASAEANPYWGRAMEMLAVQKELNARVVGDADPTLDNVVTDYFDTGKVDGTWAAFT